MVVPYQVERAYSVVEYQPFQVAYPGAFLEAYQVAPYPVVAYLVGEPFQGETYPEAAYLVACQVDAYLSNFVIYWIV